MRLIQCILIIHLFCACSNQIENQKDVLERTVPEKQMKPQRNLGVLPTAIDLPLNISKSSSRQGKVAAIRAFIERVEEQQSNLIQTTLQVDEKSRINFNLSWEVVTAYHNEGQLVSVKVVGKLNNERRAAKYFVKNDKLVAVINPYEWSGPSVQQAPLYFYNLSWLNPEVASEEVGKSYFQEGGRLISFVKTNVK